VGSAGAAGFNSGWSWTKVKDLSHDMDAVWGSGANDVYTVGSFGFVMRSTGHDDWITSQLPVHENAQAIWGSGANDIFAANRTLFHLQSGTWSALTLPDWAPNATIWALDTNNVYLGGGAATGVLAHGSAAGPWEQIPLPEGTQSIRAIWGSSSDNLYVASGSILHQSGSSAWQQELRGGGGGGIVTVSGSSATNLYAAGYLGVSHSNGDGTWTPVSLPLLKGDGPSCLFTYDDATTFVGGTASGVYVSDASGTWTLIGVGTGGSHRAIWAPSRDEVYVVGLDGVSHGRRQ
jgi:hypothetical protein